MPCVQYAFGLFDGSECVGVVTYGLPPNFAECEAWKPWPVLELNRLCVDCDRENASSTLVGRSLARLKQLHHGVIISYADMSIGHVGYIYQATNWTYTGIGGSGHPVYKMVDGSIKHPRHERTIPENEIASIEKSDGKHRYYFFAGNKHEQYTMRASLRFKVFPYPKGKTKRYDADHAIDIQKTLF